MNRFLLTCLSLLVSVCSYAVASIQGPTSLCQGSTITLTDSTTGGTWSSSNTAVAAINGTTGVLVGNSPGTAIISYSSSSGTASTVITVNALPGAIGGTLFVCTGSTTTLTNGTSGGTWSSSAPARATVGLTSGIVTGVTAGTATISYSINGCSTTRVVTVTSSPAAISGQSVVCLSSTVTFTDATVGGFWSSSAPTIGSIGSTSGVVRGLSLGTTSISYTVGSCRATKTVTVISTVPAITGPSSVCVSSAITMSNTATGGAWSSSSVNAIAGSTTGQVYGNVAGAATISYQLSGCPVVTKSISVLALPSAISGPNSVCAGASITLADTTTGGAWSSGNTTAATVGTTGIVSGISADTATIYYTGSNGCSTFTILNVLAAPAAISGPSVVCTGAGITLSSLTTGGTWVSSNTSIASIGSSSGIVSGISAGNATITYLAGGCAATKSITVSATPAASTGPTSVCTGSSILLSNGTPGGTWSSGNTSVATVDSAGMVTGVNANLVAITYSLGSCAPAITIVTVQGAPAAIAGSMALCAGGTTTLTNATAGGTWVSSNPLIASIGSASGVVTGISTGTTTITYTAGVCGVATAVVTVTAAPAAITGSSNVCVGATTTLTNSVSGGSWTSSNTALAVVTATGGLATGLSAGTTAITYALGGCATTIVLTVSPAVAPITGAGAVCTGSTATLSSITSGGSWVSATPSIATVIPTMGVITGVSAGTASITYTLGTCASSAIITVNAAPGANTGTATVCTGATALLANSTPGGSWSSSNTAVATVASSGLVTGTGSGTAIISYVAACGTATTVVTVAAAPAITGSGTLCSGSSITLSATPAGGSWSSTSPGIATIGGSSGIVTGVTSGVALVTYTSGSGCSASATVTVSASLPAIGGSSSVCIGSTTLFTNSISGGTWSSNLTGIATAGLTTGIITGISNGIATIKYAVAGCGNVTKSVTVGVGPAAITGSSTVCTGTTIGLLNTTTGGTWSSSNTAQATVTATTGIVSGIAPGIVTISYTTASSCAATKVVTVIATPPAISGGSSICTGSSMTLGNSLSGGTWSSTNTTVASVGISSGIVAGATPGTATIYYWRSGCNASRIVTITATAASITGTPTVCTTGTTTLANATSSGTWSSSNPARATVGASTGIVTGVSAGAVNIYYIVSSGCSAVRVVTVAACSGKIGGTVSSGGARGTTAGVAGVILELHSSEGNLIRETTTTADGTYNFSDLEDGTYYVLPVLAGYTGVRSAAFGISGDNREWMHIGFTVNAASGTITPSITSVAATADEATITAVPNPTSGLVSISWSGLQQGDALITVADVTGRQVLTTPVIDLQPSGRQALSLGTLPDGVYIISMYTAGTEYRTRIILQQ